MLVFAIVDRFLDIVGGLTILYWAVKLTYRWATKGSRTSTKFPRSERL